MWVGERGAMLCASYPMPRAVCRCARVCAHACARLRGHVHTDVCVMMGVISLHLGRDIYTHAHAQDIL